MSTTRDPVAAVLAAAEGAPWEMTAQDDIVTRDSAMCTTLIATVYGPREQRGARVRAILLAVNAHARLVRALRALLDETTGVRNYNQLVAARAEAHAVLATLEVEHG